MICTTKMTDITQTRQRVTNEGTLNILQIEKRIFRRDMKVCRGCLSDRLKKKPQKEAASLEKKGQIHAIVLYNKKPTTFLKMISPLWVINSTTFHTTLPKASRIAQDSKNTNSRKHLSKTQAVTTSLHTFSVWSISCYLCCLLNSNAFPFNFTL